MSISQEALNELLVMAMNDLASREHALKLQVEALEAELASKSKLVGHRTLYKLKDEIQLQHFLTQCIMSDATKGTRDHDHITGILSSYKGKITFPCILVHDENFQNDDLGAMIFKADLA